MIKNIPHNRLVIYLVVICLLPLVLVATNFLSQQRKIRRIENRVEEVHQLAVLKGSKQAPNAAALRHFRDADHFYIDKHLETLELLEEEMEILDRLVNNQAAAENVAVSKRLDFLQNSNKVEFSEGVVQSYPMFQETVETLVHSVEVDVVDLQEILAKIEGVQIGPYGPAPSRPQLIITDFRLEKKESVQSNEVFVLQLKLLKREFL